MKPTGIALLLALSQVSAGGPLYGAYDLGSPGGNVSAACAINSAGSKVRGAIAGTWQVYGESSAARWIDGSPQTMGGAGSYTTGAADLVSMASLVEVPEPSAWIIVVLGVALCAAGIVRRRGTRR